MLVDKQTNKYNRSFFFWFSQLILSKLFKILYASTVFINYNIYKLVIQLSFANDDIPVVYKFIKFSITKIIFGAGRPEAILNFNNEKD